MKNRLSTIFSLYCLPFLFHVPISQAEDLPKTLTLQDAYTLTLRQSEQLKIRAEEIKIAEAQYRQALSAVYPNIELGARQNFRDNADFGRVSVGRVSLDDPASPTGGRSGSLGRTQFEGVVTVEQLLFNGFREFLIAESIERTTDALNLELVRNRELLFLDVADLFFQVLRAEYTLKVYAETERTLRVRVRELREFIDLGKSRESEVIAADSDLADLAAARERTQGVLGASRELLAFLTGVPADQLKLAVEAPPDLRAPITEYLARAQRRADLRAAEERVRAQEQRLLATERQRWPSLSLLGNGYLAEDPDRNRDWEVMANLSIPVFEGGRISAETDEERARLETTKIAKSEQQRITEREVRVAYNDLRAAEAELGSLKKLRAANQKNLESQRRDYTFGVVTNLDVLQAIRQLQDAARRLLDAEAAVRINGVRLDVATGGIAVVEKTP